MDNVGDYQIKGRYRFQQRPAIVEPSQLAIPMHGMVGTLRMFHRASCHERLTFMALSLARTRKRLLAGWVFQHRLTIDLPIKILLLDHSPTPTVVERCLTRPILADQRTHSGKEWGKYQAPDEPV